MTRCPAPMSAGMTSSQFCQLPLRPWTRTTTGPSPTSMALTARPSTGTQRWAARQSTSIQDAGWRVRTSSVRRSAARGSATRDYASGVVGFCPAAMRIAIDIDSTLHHYWDVLSRGRERPFRRRPPVRAADHVGHHAPEAAAGPGLRRGHAPRRGDPGRDAVPRRGGDGPRLARGGHFIHITSHRAVSAQGATATWLQRDRAALRRAVLLDGQDRPLPGDRHRPARRRQPGQHRARRRRGHRGGDDRATRGTATCARTRTSCAPRTGPSCGASWRRCWSRRTTRPERRAQLSARVRDEPVPGSLHAHQFPRRGRYRLPALPRSSTNPHHG